MARRRRQFSREYKLEAVRLASEGDRPLAEVARELGIRAEQLRRWKKRVEERPGLGPGDVFPGNGHRSSDEEEVRRLRRELELVKQERDFLKKAAAYFAKESR